MIIISAMGRNRVIGNGDGMPWHVPDEYQHFLETTRDQTIIIGRRSFEIFGPTLTCAHCYVVSRGDRSFANAVTVPSLEQATQLAQQQDRNIFVAGGASIYAQAIDQVDSMQLSYINGEFDGDRFFPEFDKNDWTVTCREDRGSYEFVEYQPLPKPK